MRFAFKFFFRYFIHGLFQVAENLSIVLSSEEKKLSDIVKKIKSSAALIWMANVILLKEKKG